MSNHNIGWVYQLGQVAYDETLSWQRHLVSRHKQALDIVEHPDMSPVPDILMLQEHPPVYTVGQGGDMGFVRFDPTKETIPVVRVERGGEVTYHCPGQLVGYPVLNLYRHKRDLHWYLRQLEEVVIRTLTTFGLGAERIPGLTGVWVKGHKLAAIGIKVSRWITMHGFALNVCPQMAGFEKIVPCGIADRPVGAMAQFIPGITIDEVSPVLIESFSAVFELKLVAGDRTQLMTLLNELPTD